MGGGGLLIFYVTNETNETNVRPSKSPKTHPKIRDFRGPRKGRLFHFAAFCGKNTEFCRILRQPFPRKSRTFAPNFKAR